MTSTAPSTGANASFKADAGLWANEIATELASPAGLAKLEPLLKAAGFTVEAFEAAVEEHPYWAVAGLTVGVIAGSALVTFATPARNRVRVDLFAARH